MNDFWEGTLALIGALIGHLVDTAVADQDQDNAHTEDQGKGE